MSGCLYFALFMVVLTLLSAACTARPEPAVISELQSDVSWETVPDVAPSAVEELVAGNNGFAFDLFHAVAQEDGNLFFSPYSISTALAMTYAGARGETAAQMADALYYTLPQSQLHPAFNALNLRLTTSDNEEEFELAIANALWSQEGEEFRQEYLDLLDSYYEAEMHLVNFKSEAGREAVGKRINQWVSDATAGRIPDLVDPHLFLGSLVNPAAS